MNAPLEPGLGQLVRALTADGQPGELSGRDAALAAFRAANQPSPAPSQPAARPLAPARARRSRRLVLPVRLAAAAAAGAAVVGGFTAAAYAQVLPGPVQQIAHSVLAPIGVPNKPAVRPRHQVSPPSRLTQGSSAPPGVTTASSGTGSSGGTGSASAGAPSSGVSSTGRPATGAPSTGGPSTGGPSTGSASPVATTASPSPSPGSTSPAPTPTPAGSYRVTLSAARARVPSAAVDVLTGRVTQHGQAAANAIVQLEMRLAGTTTWTVTGTAQTGPHGYFRISSPSLTATAAFRVTGPDDTDSAAVRVTVGQPVRIKLVTGTLKDQLTVTAKAARPGDPAVLQELVSGVWTTVKSKPLGPGGNAAFTVSVKVAAGNYYRGAVLIAGTLVPSAEVLVPSS